MQLGSHTAMACEPLRACPFAHEDDDFLTPEQAGVDRIAELEEALANPGDTLNGDLLLQAIQDYQGTSRGEEKTWGALIDAAAAAKSGNDKQCADVMRRWFDLVASLAANEAEEMRLIEIDRQLAADEAAA